MISQELAELAGLFAADGCMQKTVNSGYVCFWGNISEDRVYYDQYIAKLFQKEFGITPRLHEKRSNSVYGFYCCVRSVRTAFQELGFHSGSKTYTVQVPENILSDSTLHASFIRGFFDGDGCLFFLKRKGPTYSEYNLTHHNYPRIFLSSRSAQIIKQVKTMLEQLGINSRESHQQARLRNEQTCYRLIVQGKPQLEKWMSVIGTSNPAQKSRYLLWKKQGFCPPRTTVAQRMALLA